ncbi:MAG TPA: DsbA family protein [Solirubrobacteraceae bacterium]|nr:DsbA family protein [Solirubrobacteraceae bacterium]
MTLYSDPACPWAYSATPAITALRWRYGDQLDWRLVTIGLRDDPPDPATTTYTPARQASGARRFRDRYGMPFAAAPRSRLVASGRGCRAVVATRLSHPGREFAALRALAFGWFTTADLLDEDAAIVAALEHVAGIDAEAVVAAIDSAPVTEAYEADKAEARSAAGGPTAFQGKAAVSDGLVRYTAPSLIFKTDDGRSLEAGGFQPLEAYDVLIANLDTGLERRLPPEDGPLDLLRQFPAGLCTQEVAVAMAGNLMHIDRSGTEDALLDLVADGAVTRTPLGDDALWRAAQIS